MNYTDNQKNFQRAFRISTASKALVLCLSAAILLTVGCTTIHPETDQRIARDPDTLVFRNILTVPANVPFPEEYKERLASERKTFYLAFQKYKKQNKTNASLIAESFGQDFFVDNLEILHRLLIDSSADKEIIQKEILKMQHAYLIRESASAEVSFENDPSESNRVKLEKARLKLKSFRDEFDAILFNVQTNNL